MTESRGIRSGRIKRHLPPEIVNDRLARYFTGEPLESIAADHGVHSTVILRTVKRYAPWAIGMRSTSPRRNGPAQNSFQ